MNLSLKKILPHIVAIVVFFIVSLAYFGDIASGSKQIKQHDIKMYQGAAAEAGRFSKENKEVIFFTGSMFSGMPMYLVSVPFYGNIINTSYLNGYMMYRFYPMGQFLMLMLGFYIFLISLKVNPYIALIGSVAFAFSSNNIVFTSAGHSTKVVAIAYFSFVLAGINMILRRNKWWGASLLAVGMSLQVGANHFQITYYMLLLIAIWLLVETVYYLKEKKIKELLVKGLFISVALGLGLIASISNVQVNKEYGEYTIRGKSELTLNKTEAEKEATGLDKGYTFEYSYSGIEPLTMLIPNLYGGAEEAPFDKSSETYKLLSQQQNAKGLTQYLLGYWGQLRITMGPPYFGAIVVFLFVLGCIIVRGPLKWTMIIATIFSIALSYGKNLEWFNYWMFDHFPYYNKFRAVTTSFVIAQVCMPILGFLGLKEIMERKNAKDDVLKKLYWAAGITSFMCFIFIVAPGTTFDLSSAKYAQVFGDKGVPPEYAEAIEGDCAKIVRSDAIRSLFLIVLSAGLIYIYLKNILKFELVMGLLTLLVVGDIFLVDKRYLGEEQMEKKKKKTEEVFPKTFADTYILNDNKDGAKVLNLSVSPFNDASTSYYHRSIGGYSGAKLRRYQELIENRLYPEIQYLSENLKNSKNTDLVTSDLFASTSALNMLNTKYVIINPQAQPILNNKALGNSWFVRNFELVANPDSEIVTLNRINTATTCVIDERFKTQIGNFAATYDTSASIKQISYHPNRVSYESNSNSPQMAVFSEIYYEPDWEMYLDGVLTNYYRCNYVLRGTIVPAGKHLIEFKINPKSYTKWEKISKVASYGIFVLVALSILMWYKERKKNLGTTTT